MCAMEMFAMQATCGGCQPRAPMIFQAWSRTGTSGRMGGPDGKPGRTEPDGRDRMDHSDVPNQAERTGLCRTVGRDGAGQDGAGLGRSGLAGTGRGLIGLDWVGPAGIGQGRAGPNPTGEARRRRRKTDRPDPLGLAPPDPGESGLVRPRPVRCPGPGPPGPVWTGPFRFRPVRFSPVRSRPA